MSEEESSNEESSNEESSNEESSNEESPNVDNVFIKVRKYDEPAQPAGDKKSDTSNILSIKQDETGADWKNVKTVEPKIKKY